MKLAGISVHVKDTAKAKGNTPRAGLKLVSVIRKKGKNLEAVEPALHNRKLVLSQYVSSSLLIITRIRRLKEKEYTSFKRTLAAITKRGSFSIALNWFVPGVLCPLIAIEPFFLRPRGKLLLEAFLDSLPKKRYFENQIGKN